MDADARDAAEAAQPKPNVSLVKPPPPQQQTYTGGVTIDKPVPPQPVSKGPALLVYLLPSAGTVRIVDVTSGADLATVTGKARSIVRIDQLTGVQLDRQTLVRGPLPRDHEYAIYLTIDSASDVRREVTSPLK
jgi:hypothetical protein